MPSTTHIQREITKLKQQLLTLSADVENSLEYAYKALINMDLEIARKVVDFDQIIDDHEVELEEDCLKIMALYQPVAIDLRMVVAILKMNNDLERIADLAANIAKYVIKIADIEPIEVSHKFTLIFNEVRKMVHQSLDSLVNSDRQLAQQVRINDDIVDRLNIDIIEEIQEQIVNSPTRIRPLLYLISVSRSLERIGDNATNIAEDVIYMCDGAIVRHNLKNPPPPSDAPVS